MRRLSRATELLVIALAILAAGCNGHHPRPRMGTLPTPPPGPRFEDPNNLGRHSYYFNPFECNGIVYTCKAGHIDITHVRWAADHTKFLTETTYKLLMKKDPGFSFILPLENSKHIVEFTYPPYWDNLSRKEKAAIADVISLEAGPYLAFNATLWHEILTWFGVRFMGFEPEFNSAFSWEDTYSNLLGTQIAVRALRDNTLDYDAAMTRLIDQELADLGVQSKKTAIYASEKMRGKWFKGYLLVDTMRKNLDVGLDDGHITPVLVPGICNSAAPEPRPVPTIDVLSKCGFSMKYEILPREWEKGRFLKIAYGDKKGKTILPEKHFPAIMAYIRDEAVEKYGYTVD